MIASIVISRAFARDSLRIIVENEVDIHWQMVAVTPEVFRSDVGSEQFHPAE